MKGGSEIWRSRKTVIRSPEWSVLWSMSWYNATTKSILAMLQCHRSTSLEKEIGPYGLQPNRRAEHRNTTSTKNKCQGTLDRPPPASDKKSSARQRSASNSCGHIFFESGDDVALVEGTSDSSKPPDSSSTREDYTRRVTIETTLLPDNVMDMWGEKIKSTKPGDPSRLTYRKRMNQADKVKERIERRNENNSRKTETGRNRMKGIYRIL